MKNNTESRSTVYGYCRISTAKQSIDRQERNIIAAYPEAVLLKEVFTGTTTERPLFDKMMSHLHAGDTIVFDSVSRMSRNAQEGFALYQRFYADGVSLVFLKEPQIDTATYQNAMSAQIQAVNCGDDATDELMNSIFQALNRYTMRLAEKQIQLAFEQAEKEVEDLHQRTREGIQTARLAGKQIGQVQGAKLNTKKSIAAKEIIRQHAKAFGGTLNDGECQTLSGVSRNSFYKYKRELMQEQAREE